jgi:hypothetical protein
MLRARLGFTRQSHGKISLRGHAVYEGMKKYDARFPHPPVSLDDLKSQLDRFDQAIAGSFDGGRKAFAELGSAREVLTHSLKQNGHYVEGVAKKDVELFLCSGYELAGGNGKSSGECPVPRMRWVRYSRGYSGVMEAAWTPLYRQASHYELRWGLQGPNGEPPDPWTITQYKQARRPARLEALIPGKIYVFQVRAYGNNGKYTDWSAAISKMCV